MKPIVKRLANLDGHIVGNIVQDDDGTCWIEKWGLDPALHQLRIPPAWCIDVEHYHMLKEVSGAGVRLHTIDGATWVASLEAYTRWGFTIDRGHASQRALPLDKWRRVSPEQPQPQ